MKSMTGFARQTLTESNYQFTWEIRSVNHRHLDLTLRLPEELRTLETELRRQIGQTIQRGKCEAILRIQSIQESSHQTTLNQQTLNEVCAALKQIQDHFAEQNLYVNLPNGLEILRYPNVIENQLTPNNDEYAQKITKFQPILNALLQTALTEFNQVRENEGLRLLDFLNARKTAILALVERVKVRLPDVEKQIRDKLMQRLADSMADVNYVQTRLEQEMVLFLQRLDVSEEIARLEAHCAALSDHLASNEAIGRRLDFLMQEFNREANTLGSKSQDLECTRLAMDIKLQIEQMREQIQNIE